MHAGSVASPQSLTPHVSQQFVEATSTSSTGHPSQQIIDDTSTSSTGHCRRHIDIYRTQVKQAAQSAPNKRRIGAEQPDSQVMPDQNKRRIDAEEPDSEAMPDRKKRRTDADEPSDEPGDTLVGRGVDI